MGQRILVTGGAGFIGSAVVRYLIESTRAEVLNVDKLTYAGNLESLRCVADSPRYRFVKADVCDRPAITRAIRQFRPTAIMHLAAESHVDRSIDGPADFIETNIVGTYNMLEGAKEYREALEGSEKENFRFHHISTDEVYGSLGREGRFTEDTPYAPRSPYSASKASSDHLVMAWFHTYDLPVVLTNCSNNYGPYHFPEKLIPLVILNALAEKPLPVYGTGDNVRDWLYVEDHAKALWAVVCHGTTGRTYNIGGNNEKTNIEVVERICDHLDSLRPRPSGTYRDLITFVTDRLGHDRRYAIDATRIKEELGWQPEETFESGLTKTIRWYLDNPWWWSPLQ